MEESNLYFVVIDQLDDFHKSGDLETVEDFIDIIRQMHERIEEAAQDYIHDYNREDLEEEYFPMF